MPDSDADSPASAQPVTAAAQPVEARDNEPTDRVGEELADDARIWRVYDTVAREDDKERIAGWNRGLDSLALFAALFSAVTTAFIIEARGDMQPDYAQLTFLALNASLSGRPFAQEPFVIPSVARTVNGLWVASLVFSLSAALIAIMGKDWIGMYAARPVCNPRQWAEMRTYRLRCVERWYMPGVIATAPVLLHVSLLLFIAGLVLFTVPDPASQRVTLGLSVAAGALYLITALSAVVLSDSPFKSPATQLLRRACASCLRVLQGTVRSSCRTISDAARRGRSAAWRVLSNNSRSGGTLPDALPRSDCPPRTRIRDSIAAGVRAVFQLPDTALKELHYQRQRPRTRPLAASVISYVHSIRLGNVFRSSTWTDVRDSRSPELLADSLSWLNTASQAPDVFRALIFALGDLEVGGQVAPLVSSALRDRIRADIRHNHQKVDFRTLSRYVLVDCNLALVEPRSVDFWAFVRRFDVVKDPSLRCEDALAAISQFRSDEVVTSHRLADYLEAYCPAVVAQPRMLEFLLPRLPQSRDAVEGILVLAQRYLFHILGSNAFSLEAELLRHMSSDIRTEYERKVTTEYGWDAGMIGLLTFLCSTAASYSGRRAAVGLLLHILRVDHCRRLDRGYPCLVYVLGSDYWDNGISTLPRDSSGSQSACDFHLLIPSLPLRAYSSYQWDDSEAMPPPDHSRSFQLALARTLVKFLSSTREVSYAHKSCGHDGCELTISDWDLCVRCLHVLLCHPRSCLNDPNDVDRRLLIRRLLYSLALCSFYEYKQTTIEWSTILCDMSSVAACAGILTTIADHIGRLFESLHPSDTTEAEAQFSSLVSSGFASGENGAINWDLGRYLREVAGFCLRLDPSIASSLRSLLRAVMAIQPFCDRSNNLRKQWDSIGFPAGIEDLSHVSDDDLCHFFYSTQTPDPTSQFDYMSRGRHGQQVTICDIYDRHPARNSFERCSLPLPLPAPSQQREPFVQAAVHGSVIDADAQPPLGRECARSDAP